MTTLDPGASVVLTQGLLVRPFSTAFLASRAAPTMTDGFEVLVQEVMAAMTTEPWSMVTSVPSARVTLVGVECNGRPASAGSPGSSSAAVSPGSLVTGSEAGNVSATPSLGSGSET